MSNDTQAVVVDTRPSSLNEKLDPLDVRVARETARYAKGNGSCDSGTIEFLQNALAIDYTTARDLYNDAKSQTGGKARLVLTMTIDVENFNVGTMVTNFDGGQTGHNYISHLFNGGNTGNRWDDDKDEYVYTTQIVKAKVEIKNHPSEPAPRKPRATKAVAKKAPAKRAAAKKS